MEKKKVETKSEIDNTEVEGEWTSADVAAAEAGEAADFSKHVLIEDEDDNTEA